VASTVVAGQTGDSVVRRTFDGFLPVVFAGRDTDFVLTSRVRERANGNNKGFVTAFPAGKSVKGSLITDPALPMSITAAVVAADFITT
jgi:hypothetical protein